VNPGAYAVSALLPLIIITPSSANRAICWPRGKLSPRTDAIPTHSSDAAQNRLATRPNGVKLPIANRINR